MLFATTNNIEANNNNNNNNNNSISISISNPRGSILSQATTTTTSQETTTMIAPNERKCAVCDMQINDKFIMKVNDKYLHEKCLMCQLCKRQLDKSCFVRNESQFYCHQDYRAMFGIKCKLCELNITPTDYVIKLEANKCVYHINCFSCTLCKRQLGTGDHFHVLTNGKILCSRHNVSSSTDSPTAAASSTTTTTKQTELSLLAHSNKLTFNGDECRLSTASSSCRPALTESVKVEQQQNNDDNTADYKQHKQVHNSSKKSRANKRRRQLQDENNLDEENNEVEDDNDQDDEEDGEADDDDDDEFDDELDNELDADNIINDELENDDQNNDDNNGCKNGGDDVDDDVDDEDLINNSSKQQRGKSANNTKTQIVLTNSNRQQKVQLHPQQHQHLHQHQHQHQLQSQQERKFETTLKSTEFDSKVSVSSGNDEFDANGKRRGPRTTIKPSQLETLRRAFENAPKPPRQIRERLAQETGLNMRVIQVWFQNRRSKERRLKNTNVAARRNLFRSTARRSRASQQSAAANLVAGATANTPIANGFQQQSLTSSPLVGKQPQALIHHNTAVNRQTLAGSTTLLSNQRTIVGQQQQQHQQQQSQQTTTTGASPMTANSQQSPDSTATSASFADFSDSSNQDDSLALNPNRYMLDSPSAMNNMQAPRNQQFNSRQPRKQNNQHPPPQQPHLNHNIHNHQQQHYHQHHVHHKQLPQAQQQPQSVQQQPHHQQLGGVATNPYQITGYDDINNSNLVNEQHHNQQVGQTLIVDQHQTQSCAESLGSAMVGANHMDWQL